LQAAGIGARRQEVQRLFKVAKGIEVASRDEIFRPQDQVPEGDALAPWPVKNPGGIAQTVTLVYRDRATGERKTTHWRTITPNGMKREQAIATAIAAYAEHADDYEQDLEGAVHTSAQLLVPKFGG
jgi:hypothetical protein